VVLEFIQYGYFKEALMQIPPADLSLLASRSLADLKRTTCERYCEGRTSSVCSCKFSAAANKQVED
jgi:hypothetical protein